MGNIRVSLLASCLDDNVEKLSELSNCADSVHTHPVNAYQHFVNAFVYINNSYGRQDAARKAQEVWKVGSDEKKDYILKEAFRKIEMTTKRNYVVQIRYLCIIVNNKYEKLSVYEVWAY